MFANTVTIAPYSKVDQSRARNSMLGFWVFLDFSNHHTQMIGNTKLNRGQKSPPPTEKIALRLSEKNVKPKDIARIRILKEISDALFNDPCSSLKKPRNDGKSSNPSEVKIVFTGML